MPATVNKRVGSSLGMSDALGKIRCPLASKYLRNMSLNSFPVYMHEHCSFKCRQKYIKQLSHNIFLVSSCPLLSSTQCVVLSAGLLMLSNQGRDFPMVAPCLSYGQMMLISALIHFQDSNFYKSERVHYFKFLVYF
jgi:hypothetical protein